MPHVDPRHQARLATQRAPHDAMAWIVLADAELEAGDAAHGASVHFVVPELDAGTVLAQARVPVLAGDTPETLAQRVLAVEHPLLIASLQWLVSGRVAERHGQLVVDGHPLFSPLRLDSAGKLNR